MSIGLVSVIMNCYNGEAFVEKAINSVLKQSYNNWEIIFWDNKSTDNTSKIVSKFRNDKIKYFYSEKFTNLYTARNLALEKANGKFITFLDVDDWWHEEKLTLQSDVFRNNDKVDIVYTNYYYVTNDKMRKVYQKELPNGNIFNQLLQNNFIGVSTLMVKREIFDKIKFENEFHIIGDYDFTLKASRWYNFFYINKPLLFYNWHGNNESLKKEKLKIDELNILYKNLKNFQDINEFEKHLIFFKNTIIYYEFLYLAKEKKLNLTKVLFSKITTLRKLKIIVLIIGLKK